MALQVWEYQRLYDRKWKARMLAVDRARCVSADHHASVARSHLARQAGRTWTTAPAMICKNWWRLHPAGSGPATGLLPRPEIRRESTLSIEIGMYSPLSLCLVTLMAGNMPSPWPLASGKVGPMPSFVADYGIDELNGKQAIAEWRLACARDRKACLCVAVCVPVKLTS